MIPDLVEGHLPIGRFGCTLEELHAEFVEEPRYVTSHSRRDLWDGLLKYLAKWEEIHDRTGLVVLERMWIGGSFVSGEMNPSDIDVSPILCASSLALARRKKCSGRINALIKHRDGVRRHYGVEPFVIEREPLTSIFLKNIGTAEYEYLAVRGIFDDFWMRMHAGGSKKALTEDTAQPRRGYLEVDPWL